MKKVPAFFTLWALLASTCLARIEWTYHPRVHGIDGWTSPYVTAMLGGNEITYVPPVKWSVSDERIIPPEKTEADAYFDVVRIDSPAPWTPDRITEEEKMVLTRMIPRGSTNPIILSEGPLPFRPSGQDAYEICFSYDCYARQFNESVVFVEHDKVQLQAHFGSLKKDFPDLHSAFVASLFTFHGF